MTNNVRKRIQILVVVFIAMLIMTRIYLQVYPDSEIFKEMNDGTNSINSITNKNTTIDDYSKYDNLDLPFTILTGASGNHFCPLKSFLYKTHEAIKGYKNARVIVYDLGLTNKQKKELDEMRMKGYLTILKTFDWTKYPSFWNISIARGEYAWKPGMIYETSREYPGIIMWLDSGTKFEKKFLKKIVDFLNETNGFISPTSPGHMRDWTHPGVYNHFNDDHTKYDDLPNCNGASVVFDTYRTQSLIDVWYECALEKDCIAPPGSSRKNHRQDQALLTYFAAKEKRYCDKSRSYFGFRIHDDGNCKVEIAEYESEHL